MRRWQLVWLCAVALTSRCGCAEQLESMWRNEKVIRFIQVSDIHISLFQQPEIAVDLKDFLRTYIELIKPDLLLLTGDLVDAKTQDKIGSKQFKQEWETYEELLMSLRANQQRMNHSMSVLDVRGNHDAFDVASVDGPGNLYQAYSSTRRSQHFVFTHSAPFGRYSFVNVDACPKIGARRPFNFFGVLTVDDLAQLRQLDAATAAHNMTVWISHYPMSTIVQLDPAVTLRQTIRNGVAYLCGHLHTLGGLLWPMYSRDNELLQLELADWKDHRLFRLGVIDHDSFAFVDDRYNRWPLVVVTYPKATEFVVATRDALHRQRRSPTVRFLCYSPFAIATPFVSVDGKLIDTPRHVGGGLFVAPWNASLYADGRLHTLTVICRDNANNSRSVRQQFNVSELEWGEWSYVRYESFSTLAALMLSVDHATLLSCGLIASVGGLLLALLLLRIFFNRCLTCARAWALRHCCSRCLAIPLLWLLSLVAYDLLFALVIGYMIYLLVGPYFVGELMTDHYGVQFSFGIIMSGHFIPCGVTLFYALQQVLTVAYPLTVYIGWLVSRSLGRYRWDESQSAIVVVAAAPAGTPWTTPWVCSRVGALAQFVPAAVFVGWMCVNLRLTYYAYGMCAVLLNPPRTWFCCALPLVLYAATRPPVYVFGRINSGLTLPRSSDLELDKQQ